MGFPRQRVYSEPDNIKTNLEDVHYGYINPLFQLAHNWDSHNLTHTLMSTFAGSASNVFHAYKTYDELRRGVEPSVDELKQFLPSEPADDDYVKSLKKDREGIDIPQGATKETADAITGTYDDDRYYAWKHSRISNSLGSISAFAGDLITGLVADPVTTIATGGVTRGVSAFYKPIASEWMQVLRTKDFMGSGAARLATRLSTAVTTAAGFGAFTAGGEAGEDMRMVERGQQPDYVQSVLNVGESAGWGSLFGAGGGVIGRMMESPHYEHLSGKAKSNIKRFYRGWSQEADESARQDATMQMMDGKEPKVSPIIRQGSIEEGIKFRQTMREQGVDLGELSGHLDETKASIQDDMVDHMTVNQFKEPLKRFASAIVRMIKDNPDVEFDPREVITNMAKEIGLSDHEADRLFSSVSEFMPEAERNARVTEGQILHDIKHRDGSDHEPTDNVKRIHKLEGQIKNLQEVVDNPDEHPVKRRKAKKRIAKLKEKIPNTLSPADEIAQIEADIAPDGEPVKNIRRTKGYRRLFDMARGSHLARNALAKVTLGSEKMLDIMAERIRKDRLADLYQQYNVADNMQRHVDGTHPSVSPADQKAYYDHIQSAGIDDIDYEMPDADEKIDEVLAKFDDQFVNDLSEKTGHQELKEGWDQVKELQAKQGDYKSMAKQLVDCFLEATL